MEDDDVQPAELAETSLLVRTLLLDKRLPDGVHWEHLPTTLDAINELEARRLQLLDVLAAALASPDVADALPDGLRQQCAALVESGPAHRERYGVLVVMWRSRHLLELMLRPTDEASLRARHKQYFAQRRTQFVAAEGATGPGSDEDVMDNLGNEGDELKRLRKDTVRWRAAGCVETDLDNDFRRCVKLRNVSLLGGVTARYLDALPDLSAAVNAVQSALESPRRPPSGHDGGAEPMESVDEHPSHAEPAPPRPSTSRTRVEDMDAEPPALSRAPPKRPASPLEEPPTPAKRARAAESAVQTMVIVAAAASADTSPAKPVVDSSQSLGTTQADSQARSQDLAGVDRPTPVLAFNVPTSDGAVVEATVGLRILAPPSQETPEVVVKVVRPPTPPPPLPPPPTQVPVPVRAVGDPSPRDGSLVLGPPSGEVLARIRHGVRTRPPVEFHEVPELPALEDGGWVVVASPAAEDSPTEDGAAPTPYRSRDGIRYGPLDAAVLRPHRRPATDETIREAELNRLGRQEAVARFFRRKADREAEFERQRQALQQLGDLAQLIEQDGSVHGDMDVDAGPSAAPHFNDQLPTPDPSHSGRSSLSPDAGLPAHLAPPTSLQYGQALPQHTIAETSSVAPLTAPPAGQAAPTTMVLCDDDEYDDDEEEDDGDAGDYDGEVDDESSAELSADAESPPPSLFKSSTSGQMSDDDLAFVDDGGRAFRAAREAKRRARDGTATPVAPLASLPLVSPVPTGPAALRFTALDVKHEDEEALSADEQLAEAARLAGVRAHLNEEVQYY